MLWATLPAFAEATAGKKKSRTIAARLMKTPKTLLTNLMKILYTRVLADFNAFCDWF